MGFARIAGRAAWAAAGLAVTPLVEYAWHRWVAHGQRPDPSREGHLEHHRTARDVVAPWTEIGENAPRLAGVFGGLNVVLGAAIGLSRSLPLTAGLAGGYALTTLYHAEMHRRGPRGALEAWMWRFHWHHHAADGRANFALTPPGCVFDLAFGTATIPEEVAVPERLAPEWLRGPPAPREPVHGLRVA
jgi:hypothetical protein